MIKRILLVVTVACTSIVYGQEYDFKNVGFQEVSDQHIKQLDNRDGLLLFDQRNELQLDLASGEMIQYNMLHYQQYIATDSTAASFKKILLRNTKDLGTLKQMFRVVDPQGVAYIYPNDSIKEVTNPHTGETLMYFDVSGVKKGSVVELLTQWKEPSVIDGQDIMLQMELPIVESRYELIYPEDVALNIKSYNGVPPGEEQELEGKTKMVFKADNVTPIPLNEEYAVPYKSVRFLRYKVDGIFGGVEKNMFTAKLFADELVMQIRKPLSNKEVEAVQAFADKIEKNMSPLLTVRNIEYKIKGAVQVGHTIASQPLGQALEEHSANMLDIVRLYEATFDYFGIRYDLVLTTKGDELKYDAKFPTRLNYNDVLFYFPSLDAYLAPFSFDSLIPLSDMSYHNNEGLFVVTKQYAGMETTAYENKKVVLNTFYTKDNFTCFVDLQDLNKVNVQTKHSVMGERGIDFQKYFVFLSASKHKELEQFIAEAYSAGATDYKIKVNNIRYEDYGIQPFVFDLDYNGNFLVDYQGDVAYVSIGKVIGNQVKLEDKKPRVLPIELTTAVDYSREIKVKLPKGYKVENLSDLKMKEKLVVDGKQVGLFESSYTLKAGELTIDCKEVYDFYSIDKKYWEDYKRVINAASDFSLIKLKLVKK
ncbi:DUF3857 domain-containing protein [Myroides pelagicus]|nr:DUF3857 domain-containing protein [Myroides pelagicus]MEC4114052.1 DUF3857 domain-containing protein [Myroides pelagicus]